MGRKMGNTIPVGMGTTEVRDPEPEDDGSLLPPVPASTHSDPVEIAHAAYLKAVKAVEKAQDARDAAERRVIIAKLERGDGLDDIAREHGMGGS